jgi:hypothetical protein
LKPITPDLKLPNITLIFTGKDAVTSTTTRGTKCDAERYCYELRHRDGWALLIAFLNFENKEKDVRCFEYSENTPVLLQSLKGRLRMTVESEDVVTTERLDSKYWSQLGRAVAKKGTDPPWSNLMLATEKQLDEATGFNVRSFLLKSDDVYDYGKREAVLGEANNKRNYMCALFNLNSLDAPIYCYVISRVYPLLN